MKVLIAEDDPTTLRLLEVLLTQWGYEVVAAPDGDIAWNLLHEDHALQLAIVDWLMPGMEGVELCRRVRAELASEEHYVYLILLTSKASHEETIVGLEAGADDSMAKPFDPQELKVRVRIGQRIIELYTALMATREALREQALNDPLTGILNRRGILQRFQEEMIRSQRESKWIGAIMIDLDHFKNINDTLGHAAGDIALCECIRRIRSTLRQYDALGRLGGEEFLVATAVDEPSQVEHIAERIRLAISEREIRYGNRVFYMTASLGVAVSQGEHSMDELLHSADLALYEAKHSGRNRVMGVLSPVSSLSRQPIVPNR